MDESPIESLKKLSARCGKRGSESVFSTSGKGGRGPGVGAVVETETGLIFDKSMFLSLLVDESPPESLKNLSVRCGKGGSESVFNTSSGKRGGDPGLEGGLVVSSKKESVKTKGISQELHIQVRFSFN